MTKITAQTIKNLRYKLNLSQAELAKKLNFSTAWISKIEQEEYIPTNKTIFFIKELAKKNNINLEEL